jgi:hypothetical protein
MKSSRRHLVYYTLYLTKTARSYRPLIEQHMASVESLRRDNQSIPVCLTVCGSKLRPKDQRHLKNLRVRVRYLGSYEERLTHYRLGSWVADVFAENPNSLKWVSLREIIKLRFDSVLYVDNDTFFSRDVEELFAALADADICAREEPLTKRSYLGYDSSYLDESAMRSLLRSEKLNSIIPFNTGVVLMKRQVAEWLSLNLNLFLSYLVRFTISMARHRPARDDEAFVEIARELDIDETRTGLAALRYPCSNQWIVGQLALWFTFAARRFKLRLFPRSLVLQGDEFLKLGRQFRMPALFHYYSGNSEYFFRWIRRVDQSSPRVRDRAK